MNMWKASFDLPESIITTIDSAKRDPQYLVADYEILSGIIDEVGDFEVTIQWRNIKNQISAYWDFVYFVDSFKSVYEWLNSTSRERRVDFISQGEEICLNFKKTNDKNNIQITCVAAAEQYGAPEDFPQTIIVDLNDTALMLEKLLTGVQKIYNSAGYYDPDIAH